MTSAGEKVAWLVFRMAVSAGLITTGLAHIWSHSKWGEHDANTIIIIVLGGLIAFYPQVVGGLRAFAEIVRAWRGHHHHDEEEHDDKHDDQAHNHDKPKGPRPD